MMWLSLSQPWNGDSQRASKRIALSRILLQTEHIPAYSKRTVGYSLFSGLRKD
jgi:hypothetical protein